MLESLTKNLQSAFSFLRGSGKLTESNIKEGMREVRKALLEADVNFAVVKEFTQRVTQQAVGLETIKSVRPEHQFIKIVKDELEDLMGPVGGYIDTSSASPTVIMMAGLQGSGKTTSCAKLAKYLVKKGRKPLLVAADLQRPAAIDQLEVLGRELDIPVYAEREGRAPKVCERAVAHARREGRDVVILDTAGRLHIDDALMEELSDIQARTRPVEIFLVCDAMTGQDAVQSAKAFDERLALTGIILTKLDGDARGGAALSIKSVTGKPIKFVGVGEKLGDFEEFHPDRMASRILGMGDVVSLVERAQEHLDEEQSREALEKALTDSFTFDDFLQQLQQIKKLGSLKDLLSMLPGVGGALADMPGFDDGQLVRVEAMIQSMTAVERMRPEVIDASRRLRIARGSGSQVGQVNDLLKQFKEMRKMFKGLRTGGLLGRMMPGMGGVSKKRKLQQIRQMQGKLGMPGVDGPGAPGLAPGGGRKAGSSSGAAARKRKKKERKKRRKK
jgi:signal recognition particle subunit SRP54